MAYLRNVLALCLFVLVWACEKNDRIPSSTGVKTVRNLYPLVPEGSSSGDTTHQGGNTNHPDDEARLAMEEGPLTVVSLLARWDSAGKSLNPVVNPVYDSARRKMLCWVPEANCETDEPGWDTFNVIRGYHIRLVKQQDDSARVVVEYDLLAEGTGGHVVPKSGATQWFVRLRRMSGHWRVVDPESQKAPSLSVAATLRYMAHTSSDSVVIQQLK